MNAKKEFIGSKEPATKGDLENLREDLQVDMLGIKNDILDTLRAEMHEMEMRLMKKIELILAVTQDTNKRLAELEKKLADMPERVAALEDDVLRLKAKVF